ncbi:DUF397 domain-containing protein [Streptomyces sp. H10-C2]|uniref:DUF397 domain-containing protein n=1 Tax=unclassified Streptomyces TaxID=2593676 RepID=UPI0024B96A3E|nr:MULTISPECIES: DUF397 domain-containing protein [unclassified Streptomyces]MDJ0340782.1 DUF397 domain-containing protein [Streptomyces sp. PH10-H1]MDJ0371622.1 DUF397 domain-containing protein [Streptomyces sp. H10-C2]
MNDVRKAELYAFDLSAAAWRKASASAGENNCVEIADLPNGAVAVRDSKNPGREPLRFDALEWAAFREGIITGEL